jgi:RimJ/RimL family protein N-acetyltransferase
VDIDDGERRLVASWPLFGLELRANGLALRLPRDEDAVAHGDIVHRLLPPEHRHRMPRLMDEARADTVETTTANVLRYVSRQRADAGPERWALPFAVRRDGLVVGMQAIHGERFAATRCVSSGSYVDPDQQGRGIGRTMRAIMLEFAFAHLGATTALSGYIDGNEVSRKISEGLGYVPNGTFWLPFGTGRVRDNGMRLDADRWPAHRPDWLDELEVVGLDAARPLLIGTS